MHPITFPWQDLGLRGSCTADNLRSPSVAGTNGRINGDLDDDLNTDYAESDVMLGGNGSNGNGSGASGEFEQFEHTFTKF